LKRYTNLIVPFDFSKEAHIGLRAAANLLKTLNGRIHLVNFSATDDSYQKIKQVIPKLKKTLAKEVPKRQQGSVYFVTEDLPDSIGKFTHNNDFDLIVAGISSTNNLWEYFLKNDIEKVIQHANIPVLSVSQESNFQLKNILIVTDLSQAVPGELFALAKYFQQAGGIIRFVNVINKEVIKEQEVINKILALARNYDIENYEIHVLFGEDEADEIIKMAKRSNADVILMKTYKRSQFWSMLIDSLAENVLRESNRPVLVERVELNNAHDF